MKELIQKIQSNESLWYPCCGDDLRVVHDMYFNNLYISPKILILNDCESTFDLSHDREIPGCELITSKSEMINDEIKVTSYLLKLRFGNHSTIKNLFFFKCTNTQMLNFLSQHGIRPTTLFLHGFVESFDPLPISIIDIINLLKIKYCYTSNVTLLSINSQSYFGDQLLRLNMRYIRTGSYFGKGQKYLKANYEDVLSLNYHDAIHLFEFNQNI
jgi:hypothetical protein